VGNLRRDPFAMKPFCGYNMADYFAHWFAMGDRLGENRPRIFYVNWFQKDADGRWLWPGFGDNCRVLKWMCERIRGNAGAQETPIGYVPNIDDLDLTGLDWSMDCIAESLVVDIEAYKAEVADIEQHLAQFGDRLPERMIKQLQAHKRRLDRQPAQTAYAKSLHTAR
jgi:phosphoenolpyruvate carboxykinase (GTP)